MRTFTTAFTVFMVLFFSPLFSFAEEEEVQFPAEPAEEREVGCPEISNINEAEARARVFFDANDFQGALNLLECADEQLDHPLLLQYRGRCHAELGNFCEAAMLYQEYLEQATGLDTEIRAEVESRINALEEQCDAVGVVVPPEVLSPPGAEEPAEDQEQVSVEVVSDQQEEEETPNRTLRTAGWILTGIGLAGMTAGGISWIVAGAQYYGENPYEIPTAAYAGDWMLFGGSLPTLVGVILLVIDRVRSRESPSSNELSFDPEFYAFTPF